MFSKYTEHLKIVETTSSGTFSNLGTYNCYIILSTINYPTKIPIIEVDEMFKLETGKFDEYNLSPEFDDSNGEVVQNISDSPSSISHSKSGEFYAVSSDNDLLHRC